jgi:hypothetical protein
MAPEKKAVARQRLSKRDFAATNTHNDIRTVKRDIFYAIRVIKTLNT